MSNESYRIMEDKLLESSDEDSDTTSLGSKVSVGLSCNYWSQEERRLITEIQEYYAKCLEYTHNVLEHGPNCENPPTKPASSLKSILSRKVGTGSAAERRNKISAMSDEDFDLYLRTLLRANTQK